MLFKKSFFFILFIISGHIFSQGSDNFMLQGIIYGNNYQNVVGTIYIQKKGNTVEIRREFLNDDRDFLLTSVDLKEESSQMTFTEQGVISQHFGLKNQMCKSIVTLQNEDSLGYFRGKTTSRQCRGMDFNVIAYRSKLPFNEGNTNDYNNFWVKNAQRNILKNYPAPEIMEQKRKDFKLFTIYFDYDKYDIRSEYLSKLQEMSMIVDSHTDYRIKITGFTDSDGSDIYNDTLSYNRAMAIKDYFVNRGILSSKIVIEFKGEKSPVADNKTKEGKQLNRRVIIGFI